MYVNKVLRGDIFYIAPSGEPIIGSEQRPGRPAIIVSNNMQNSSGSVVLAVYLTTQKKPPLPTHVYIDYGRCKDSTVLCEQVVSISTLRIGDYIESAADDTMKEIGKALCIALELPSSSSASKVVYKDKIVEKIVEVPVEKIVEKIVEKEGTESRYTKEQLAKARKEAEVYRSMYEHALGISLSVK